MLQTLLRASCGNFRGAFRAVQLPRSMPLSLCLVGVCATLEWLRSAWGPGDLSHAALFHMGGDRGVSVLQGEVWRLVSSTFLHAGPYHLLNNSLALLLFGALIEATLGSRRFIVLFATAALVGSIAQDAVRPSAMSCGASGAIFGLMLAALRVDTSRVRASWGLPSFAVSAKLIPPVTQRVFKVIAFILVGILLNAGANVGAAAHLAGGGVGWLLAPALQRWEAGRAERAGSALPGQRSWLTLAAWSASLIMTACVVFAIARGHAWQLREPPIERVLLGSTRVELDLPRVAAAAQPVESAGAFSFGSIPVSPMRWLVTLIEWRGPNQERAHFFQRELERANGDLDPDWVLEAPVVSVQLGNRDMIRSLKRRKGRSVEELTYQMFVGPYWVRLTAWRDGPSVWPGLDERVAASVGMYGTQRP